MRANDWPVVDPSARGRGSVRIYTQNAHLDDEAIIVPDLERRPAGCATWPGEFGVASNYKPVVHTVRTSLIGRCVAHVYN